MLAAGDTFRAAAVEQLAVWAERNGVPLVSQATGADPAAVVFDALQSAQGPRHRRADRRHGGTPAHAVAPDGRAAQDQARDPASSTPTRRTRCCWCSTRATGQNALRQAEQFRRGDRRHRHRGDQARRHGEGRYRVRHRAALGAADPLRRRRRAASRTSDLRRRGLCRRAAASGSGRHDRVIRLRPTSSSAIPNGARGALRAHASSSRRRDGLPHRPLRRRQDARCCG